MKILLVDDNATNREAIAKLLELDGHEVETGAGALDVLKRLDRVPDVVLLDYVLPGGDGLSLLREMRRHRGWDKVPVVLITADREVAPIASLKELPSGIGPSGGPFSFILKPVHVEEIYKAISQARKWSGPIEGED